MEPEPCHRLGAEEPVEEAARRCALTHQEDPVDDGGIARGIEEERHAHPRYARVRRVGHAGVGRPGSKGPDGRRRAPAGEKPLFEAEARQRRPRIASRRHGLFRDRDPRDGAPAEGVAIPGSVAVSPHQKGQDVAQEGASLLHQPALLEVLLPDRVRAQEEVGRRPPLHLPRQGGGRLQGGAERNRRRGTHAGQGLPEAGRGEDRHLPAAPAGRKDGDGEKSDPPHTRRIPNRPLRGSGRWAR